MLTGYILCKLLNRVLGKALQAEKTVIYPEYMLIEVKMNHCHVQGPGRGPNYNQLPTKGLVSEFKG